MKERPPRSATAGPALDQHLRRPVTPSTLPLPPRLPVRPVAPTSAAAHHTVTPRTAKPKRSFTVSRKVLVIALSTALLLAAASGVVKLSHGAGQVLPPAIASKVNFAVFYPANDKLVAVERKSISFNDQAGVLSYTGRLLGGADLYINQQATPESFVDIPQAYDKLIASLLPYGNFDTVNGRVSLTKPKELQGNQSAVMNAKGTLMFVRASSNITDSQWRQVFNSLKLIESSAAK
ncbi:MAG: hypothetical protein QFB87_03935 [Patescibacteria group bacterium]|nr:hypothetical protein [Patescibacteria group bacterium]